jgi:NAD(P)-dependent dehydrogenase (short-subunit alcohol dehydrogenase family)
VQISSVGGIGAFPSLGGYHASKWALEGLSESLAGEVASSGIKVTIVEPGAFATDWGGSSAVHAEPLPAYDGLRSAMASRTHQPGADPDAAAAALLQVVDAEVPPLRVLFGSGPVEMVKGIYQQRLDTWADWAYVAHTAQG